MEAEWAAQSPTEYTERGQTVLKTALYGRFPGNTWGSKRGDRPGPKDLSKEVSGVPFYTFNTLIAGPPASASVSSHLLLP